MYVDSSKLTHYRQSLFLFSMKDQNRKLNMATTTTSVSTPHRSFGIGRAFALFLIAALIVMLGALGWAYSIARSALPQLDGTLKVSGLSARSR